MTRGVLVLSICVAACGTSTSNQPASEGGGASGGRVANGTGSSNGGGAGSESGRSGASEASDAGQNSVGGLSGASSTEHGGNSTGSGGSNGCGGTAGSRERDQLACTLQPLASDYSSTWDLKRSILRGTISVNGKEMPNSPGRDSRANVEFRDVVSGRAFAVAVQVAGAGAFSARIYPGTYDVTLITSSGVGLVGMPAGAKLRLASALRIDAGTPLDFDVKTVEVAGVVTANGAPLPDSPATDYRAEIDFKDVVSGGLTICRLSRLRAHSPPMEHRCRILRTAPTVVRLPSETA